MFERKRASKNSIDLKEKTEKEFKVTNQNFIGKFHFRISTTPRKFQFANGEIECKKRKQPVTFGGCRNDDIFLHRSNLIFPLEIFLEK